MSSVTDIAAGDFHLLINAITNYAIFALDGSGNVLTWNSGAEIVSGYASEEITGQNYAQLFTHEDRSSGRPAMILEIAKQTGSCEDQAWLVRKDDLPCFASIAVDLIRNETGATIGYAVVTRCEMASQSLSEQSTLSDRSLEPAEGPLVKALRAQLYRATKLASLGQLTGEVAHDFNNFLCAVMGCLELIASHSGNSKKIRDLAQAALQASARSAALAAQLLSFAGKQVQNPKIWNVNTLVESLLPFLEHAVGSSTKFCIQLEDSALLSEIDDGHFQATLLDLVRNANEAMPLGGKLTIETSSVTPQQSAIVRPLDTIRPAYVAIRVKDTGRGMTPEVAARATEPYFTTKHCSRGSGLGLSQAYSFARQSSGYLDIESDLGRGTCVSLYLPRASSGLKLQLARPPAL